MALRITLLGHAEKDALYSKDISTRGIFVETDQPLPVGCILEMAFSIGGASKAPVQAQVRVMWITTASEARANGRVPGMGMKFGRFSQGRSELLSELQRRHLPLQAPKPSPPPKTAKPETIPANAEPGRNEEFLSLVHQALDPRTNSPSQPVMDTLDLRDSLTILMDSISWARVSLGIVLASLFLAIAIHFVVP